MSAMILALEKTLKQIGPGNNEARNFIHTKKQ